MAENIYVIKVKSKIQKIQCPTARTSFIGASIHFWGGEAYKHDSNIHKFRFKKVLIAVFLVLSSHSLERSLPAAVSSYHKF
jgi:hypothetical protein